MACCQPLKIKNKNYNPYFVNFSCPDYDFNIFTNQNRKYIEVPCGWCLNCRVDRRNWLSDACAYEFEEVYNYVGAFVTLTYDDIHILDLANKDFNNLVKDVFEDKPTFFSLRHKDFSDYVKRIRSRVNYYYDSNPNSKELPVMRKDFKVLYCGEYGDSLGRPHGHFLFFGLDFDYCKAMFEDSWKFGEIVDVKPIKNGAFEYVAKYLIKQLKGDKAYEYYDARNLERPQIHHSIRFGRGLIQKQIDKLKVQNYCYINQKGQYRPIPYYYQNLLKIRVPQEIGFQATEDSMNIFYQKNKHYSLKELNEYRHKQAILRNQRLYNKLTTEEKQEEINYQSYQNQLLPNGIYERVKIRVRRYINEIKNSFWR